MSGPPRLVEALVGLLIPPACREEVLGDLHETYSGFLNYIAVTGCTVPLVIMSRIQRTLDAQLFLLDAFASYLAYLAAARYLSPGLITDDLGLVRLAIPAAVTLLAVTLADAYAKPHKRPPLRPLIRAATGITCALISQALLANGGGPQLAVPTLVMMSGAVLSLLMLGVLSVVFAEDSPLAVNGPAFWRKRTAEPLRLSRGFVGLLAIPVVVLVAFWLSRF